MMQEILGVVNIFSKNFFDRFKKVRQIIFEEQKALRERAKRKPLERAGKEGRVDGKRTVAEACRWVYVFCYRSVLGADILGLFFVASKSDLLLCKQVDGDIYYGTVSAVGLLLVGK